MIRIGFCIVFFSVFKLVNAQYSTKQIKEGIGNNKIHYNSDKINLDSGLSSNQISNDSIYHAGALLLTKLNGNALYLRSSFCLSCHDGVSAIEGHTSTNVGNPENVETSTFFSFNHPVAFEFTRSLALSKSYLNDPYNTPSGLGGTVADDLLVEGRIECVTCHNILFNSKKKEKYEILYKSNKGSALCLTCHNR